MADSEGERRTTLFEAGVWIAIEELMEGNVSMAEGVAHITEALKWVELHNAGQLDADMKYPRMREEVAW